MHQKTGTKLFTAALFLRAKNWKWPNVSSEQKNTRTQTMEYYTTMKKNYCYLKKIWMNLTDTMLSKGNQVDSIGMKFRKTKLICCDRSLKSGYFREILTRRERKEGF